MSQSIEQQYYQEHFSHFRRNYRIQVGLWFLVGLLWQIYAVVNHQASPIGSIFSLVSLVVYLLLTWAELNLEALYLGAAVLGWQAAYQSASHPELVSWALVPLVVVGLTRELRYLFAFLLVWGLTILSYGIVLPVSFVAQLTILAAFCSIVSIATQSELVKLSQERRAIFEGLEENQRSLAEQDRIRNQHLEGELSYVIDFVAEMENFSNRLRELLSPHEEMQAAFDQIHRQFVEKFRELLNSNQDCADWLNELTEKTQVIQRNSDRTVLEVSHGLHLYGMLEQQFREMERLSSEFSHMHQRQAQYLRGLEGAALRAETIFFLSRIENAWRKSRGGAGSQSEIQQAQNQFEGVLVSNRNLIHQLGDGLVSIERLYSSFEVCLRSSTLACHEVEEHLRSERGNAELTVQRSRQMTNELLQWTNLLEESLEHLDALEQERERTTRVSSSIKQALLSLSESSQRLDILRAEMEY